MTSLLKGHPEPAGRCGWPKRGVRCNGCGGLETGNAMPRGVLAAAGRTDQGFDLSSESGERHAIAMAARRRTGLLQMEPPSSCSSTPLPATAVFWDVRH